MGEISEALSRARQEEGHARREPAASPSPGSASIETPAGASRLSQTLREVEAVEQAPPVAAPVEEATPESIASAHVIPRDREEGWIYRLCAVEPDSPAAVRFRHFAVKMRGLLDEKPRASVLVTSAVAGEGKTTVSVNLALALASIAPDASIGLVDMDLRRGMTGRAVGHAAQQGVEDVLAGRASVEEIAVPTSQGHLEFLPTVRSNPDAHSLLGARASEFFEAVHRRYDYVICDGPPVLPVPDTPLISQFVGGCLAVIAAGRTRHAAFKDVTELMPRTSWYGVFLNESNAASSKDRYGYYRPYADEPAAESRSSVPLTSVSAVAEGKGA